MKQLEDKILQILPALTDFRKDLHRNPELGFSEYRTSKKVAEYLGGLGLEVTVGVGGTGVVGYLRGGMPGKTIALRACLDALPVKEASGVPYSSEIDGVMHACGHDGNMAFVLGAATVLSQVKSTLRGTVKFLFQPSEENTGGAMEMIRAGAIDDVDAIVHLHNWHGLRLGKIAVAKGAVLASSDLFKLVIVGKPGHGAWPHLAVDPVPVAAEIISALQRIVSREIDPMKPATISIGRIFGGTAANVIPDSVTLEGTVRALDADVRDLIRNRVGEAAKSIAEGARASCEVSYKRIMPPARNDPALSDRAFAVLSRVLGPGMVTDSFPPSMGCEEFSLFQERIPGLFLFIGNDVPGGGVIPLHSPDYIFHDEILTPGIKALCALSLDWCGA